MEASRDLPPIDHQESSDTGQPETPQEGGQVYHLPGVSVELPEPVTDGEGAADELAEPSPFERARAAREARLPRIREQAINEQFVLDSLRHLGGRGAGAA